MDNAEYLNKIAAETRAAKQPGNFLNLSPTMIKLLIGAVVLSIVIIVVGMIAGGKEKPDLELDLMNRLSIRTEGVIKVMKDYNKQLKSSEIRSMGSSVSAVLTETNASVKTILKEDFEKSGKNKALEAEEKAHLESFTTTLQNAWLNGLLDRAYIHAIPYQISLILNIEKDTLAKTKKDSIIEALNKSIENLTTLKSQFENYSDPTI